ncbi:MAG: hypothetical protein A3F16_08345 [Deltaproteobacteria bacterium RIFCSPHIGHO2_12_FULL_43_9]|nr:MAG: hypothetical protein A3F16_08345 [Deltaproteobacteria bacterium RIFCSPHIGHO2_12_FULL_43_9]
MKLTKKFPLLSLSIVLSLLFAGCTPKIKFPVELSVVAKEGGREQSDVEFRSVNKVYKDGEIDTESHSSVAFSVSTEILAVKPDGKIVMLQSTTKKDGMFDLNRLGLPEVGEEIKIEIDKFGHILDVTGYPPDSLFYLPSLVFPAKRLSPGDEWKESFKWRDFAIPFPLITEINFKLVGAKRYKRFRVLRIDISASTRFADENKDVVYEGRSKGYLLWDPKNYLLRYAESHLSDTLQVPAKGFKSVSESDFVSKLKKSS